eukprot:TRINITY_DN50661_c0_g1_i1.p1 TRINITY_DN50661_c0_g1~~TRINITY_DN50661_c0_g1_i1.p1  ORF type:complete len:436 (+),score=86.74 TRINITY_DN50661_c0_g1_i1:145-1308(+)
MDFTGAAEFGELPVVRKAIRSVILDSIKHTAVLPCRIAMDLDEDDATDEADLRFPDPVGVIRILARSASGLRAADIGITGRSSDPYIVIEVGQQRWQSPVIKKSLDPVWQHGNVVDLMVYEHRQKVSISIFDEDKMTSDDLLGETPKVSMEELSRGGKPVDKQLDVIYRGKSAGTLSISTRWFVLSNNVPLKGIHPAVARGPSQFILAVKLRGIVHLPRSWKAPFVLKVQVGEREVHSANSKPPSTIRPVAAEVEAIIIRLHQQNRSEVEIAKITGLKQENISLVLAKERTPNSRETAVKDIMAELSSTHPTFNQILRLLLPWTEHMMNAAAVKMTLTDAADKLVGNVVKEIPLSELVGRKIVGPFRLSCGGHLDADLSTKWLACAE